jgi:tight adherence protein B
VNALPPGLLAAGTALLLLLGAAVLLLGRLAAQERRGRRIALAIGPHLPAIAPPAPRGDMLARLLTSPPARRVLALFGVRLDEAADLPVRWWLILLLALPLARLAAGVLALLAGGWALLATPLLWLAVSRFAFGLLRERRQAQLFRQFPDALGMIVRAVRVGIPVAEAIRQVAREAQQPTAEEFRRIADRLAVGLPLDEALAETAGRNGLAEYRFFATALSLQSATGGAVGETLDNLAEVIRKRVGLRARAIALASEARTSAAILVALPLVTMAALAFTSPQYLAELFHTEPGQRILGLAAGMITGGLLVMRSLIRRSLS